MLIHSFVGLSPVKETNLITSTPNFQFTPTPLIRAAITPHWTGTKTPTRRFHGGVRGCFRGLLQFFDLD